MLRAEAQVGEWACLTQEGAWGLLGLAYGCWRFAAGEKLVSYSEIPLWRSLNALLRMLSQRQQEICSIRI